MKKLSIFSAFIALAGLMTLNSCGEKSSPSVGGVLQDNSSLEFDPSAPSAPVFPSDDNSSSVPNTLPDEIVGLWEGYDENYVYFTVTISGEGSAILEFTDWFDEEHSYEFTYVRTDTSGWYYFAYNDDDSVEISISPRNSTFEIDDESFVINDGLSFSAFNTLYDFYKVQ